jgi:outer membrane protein assembly factor BamB
VAVGPNGTIYVPTDNGSARGDPGASHVFAYDAQGQPTGDLTITGQSSGHAHGLTSAAVDPKTGAIAVLEPDDARIVTVDVAAGTQRALTTVPDLPACLISLGANPCQQGTEDRRPFPTAVAYDPHGDLFIADPMQDTIWRLHPNEQVPEVWYQSTSFALGDGPFGLASSSGTIAFTVGSTIEPSAPGGGGLYRLVVNADGTAGALTLVAAFARGVEPGAVAVGSSGTAYVILRSTGALVAIAPAGTETFRITPPGQGPIPLDAPSGLALVAGHVLVANEGSGTDASRWALLSIAVNDGVAQ